MATTTGIGQHSVLYRVLRDMLLAYPAHALKASIMLKKQEQLVWDPTKSSAETHAKWMTYYESYDRAVALTANLEDVTLIVPAQDWATRFIEMQDVFPPWVMAMIINHPGRFTIMTTCWAAINTEALRQAAGRKQNSTRVFQLGDGARMGELDYVDDFQPYYEEVCTGAGLALCAMGGKPGCWRCGDENHLRGDCPHPSSPAELNGSPLNKWARQPGRFVPQTQGGAASSSLLRFVARTRRRPRRRTWPRWLR